MVKNRKFFQQPFYHQHVQQLHQQSHELGVKWFEKDYIEKEVFGNKIYGVLFGGTFIDIGIPEDYYKAQSINY